ncbi:hypothetical protein SAMN06264364_13525 [Quadrisphaera granulorum]|uniref:FhuF-like iron-sulfur protein n=1 Tax=Quadrisphaera granulorum TaxID=317664 RepID=A0A315ZR08_9ACTN|nr:hypothetical protein [Quadrisphaera granulorum]PWJ47722.1 hypothetical protein BXY45_13525 [Quadrisphaera granulorum]SZE98676.1 hypothetical protein SAMN06264364_13525 [Quadrisphaera granulorum]
MSLTSADVPSRSPQEWWEGRFEEHQARHDELHDVGLDGTWADLADLLKPGALQALHGRIVVAENAPANTAAKWALTWTVGPVAAAVGYAWATTGAGVLAGTGSCRLRFNPGGWPERVDLRGSTILVPNGHAWAECPGVEVAPVEELLRRTRDALVAVASPFVTALRPLGKVGATSLWAEVADDVGLCLTHAPGLDVTDDMVSRLAALLDLPGSPWKARPDVRAAPVEGGRGCLARKAGCCLAYLVPEETRTDDDGDPPARHQAWAARFPAASDPKPRTCSTCSLRELADCEERQRAWFEIDRQFSGGAQS